MVIVPQTGGEAVISADLGPFCISLALVTDIVPTKLISCFAGTPSICRRRSDT